MYLPGARNVIAGLLSLLFIACGTADRSGDRAGADGSLEAAGVVEVNGARLNYFSEGTGLPVLVLNGRFYPRTFSSTMREHLQLIFVDTRVFIPLATPDNLDSVTMDTFVEDIEAVRQALGLEQVAVAGHSAFGFLPLEYARKYPERISHAIVLACPPFLDQQYEKAASELWSSDASEERKRILDENRQGIQSASSEDIAGHEVWIRNYLVNTPRFWYDPTYDASWLFEGAEFNMDWVNHYYGVIMRDYNISDSYADIKVPVLVAVGRYDYWAPYYLWDYVKESFPDLTLYVFEQSGHFPMFEQQELFDQRLIDWITGG